MTDKQILADLDNLWAKALIFIDNHGPSRQKIGEVLGIGRAAVSAKFARIGYNMFTETQKVIIIQHLAQIKKDLAFL